LKRVGSQAVCAVPFGHCSPLAQPPQRPVLTLLKGERRRVGSVTEAFRNMP
jgi:hypothetical protein